MTRVDNTMKDKIRFGNSHTEEQLNNIERALNEIDNFDDKYGKYNFNNATVNQLKSDLRTQGQDAITNAIKTLLWVAGEVKKAIPSYDIPTAAFTDAEIDIENKDIRTHEG